MPATGPVLFPALALSLLVGLLLSGCAGQTGGGPVADLQEYAQDARLYHGLAPDALLLSEDVRRAAAKRFLDAHFGPWDRSAPRHTADEVFWGLATYADKEIYGENTLRRPKAWLAAMRDRSRVEKYPSISRKCIAVTNAAMRVLPTSRPAFLDPTAPGEGFPFDYMQNSLVLAGTPLYATHESADRAWVLVESRFAFGWVKTTDIAWVSNAVAARLRNGNYAAFTRDDVPVPDWQGIHRITAHVGTILPRTAKDSETGTGILLPIRDADGNAVLKKGHVPDLAIRPWPVPATPENFAELANTMLGRQYGWGGLYENRDCSALTMDLMAAFGIFLPRNSSQQIKQGTFASLQGLGRGEKKRFILKTATPFLTLIHKPGHIMLYVGHRDGQPLVLHAAWGIKTGSHGEYGRSIIGGAVITSLEPGLELPDLARPSGIFLETVTGLTVLPGTGAKQP